MSHINQTACTVSVGVDFSVTFANPRVFASQPDDIDGGPFARNVVKEEPPANARAIATEAEKILRQLDGVECSASRTNSQPPPPPIPAVRHVDLVMWTQFLSDKDTLF